MSYITPIHRPSGVRNALKLSFLHPDSDALVVAKANRLEVYSQTSEGWVLETSKIVYGYITMLERLRPATSTTDHLFVGTDRYQFFTCSWDASSRSIRNEQSYFDQADKVLRDSREMDRCHVDPTRRYMTLELYDGIITVIPLEQPPRKKVKRESNAAGGAGMRSLGEPAPARIEELLTRSSAFLQTAPESQEEPRLAILWEDNQEQPQLKLRQLSYNSADPSADTTTAAEFRGNLDPGVSHLIPITHPYGGFLLLGEHSITYTDSLLQQAISRDLDDKATIWSCWASVDDKRFLLGDDYGNLYFLMLEIENGEVSGWRLDGVGQASRASCLVYLDEGMVFIGSHSGDSQIVQIVEGGVQVMQSFPNLAPIVDFSVMDLGRGAENASGGDFSSGQARILTASGAWQNGTIRSVRSGVGIEELGTITSLSHITDLWALSATGNNHHHDTMIISFITETKILQILPDESFEELEDFHAFELSQPTLLASNLPDQRVVQVFETGVRVSALDSSMVMLEWRPPDADAKITAAATNSVHLLVVEGGHTLHVWHTSSPDPKPTISKTFPSDAQISSIAVSNSQSNVCIVSFWQSAAVAVLDLHSLETLHTQSLGSPGVDIPRSLLIANLMPDSPPTLLIAMADGTVLTYAFDMTQNRLTFLNRIVLGTEPVFFKLLPRDPESNSNLSNVFASCEQPSLIYSSEGRIIFSAVNSDKASRVCYFDSAPYPGAVAIATPDELKLAAIGTQKDTQIQTMEIGQTVRCLAYDQQVKLFGLGAIRRIMESGTEALLSSFKIADEVNFKELDSRELEDQELVECVISTGPLESVENSAEMQDPLFVVGTSVPAENPSGEPEGRGRILVFEVSKEKKIVSVAEQTVKGAVRSLAMCDGKIVAGLVKTVVLYAFMPTHGSEKRQTTSLRLEKLASYRTSSNPISLAITPPTPTNPALIAVADLMKSLSVIEVLPPNTSGKQTRQEWQLKEVARHFATLWSSAVAQVGRGGNEWLLADMEGNLAMLRRDLSAEDETAIQSKRLNITGEFRLGECVNKIMPILDPMPDPDATGLGKGKGKERMSVSSGSAAASNSGEKSGQFQRTGPVVMPSAFIATIEGSIYLHATVSQAFIDPLVRLQSALASRLPGLGGMPWVKYRAWKTEVRESEEPFRFIDGDLFDSVVGCDEGLLNQIIRDAGLDEVGITSTEVKSWGEELRRLC